MGRVPCTLPDDVVQTFTECQRGTLNPDTLDVDLCFDGEWEDPQYVRDTIRAIEQDLRKARLLHVEFGCNTVDPEVQKVLQRTVAPALQSLHIQAMTFGWGPMTFRAPNLRHLSLKGRFQPNTWTSSLPNSLTDLRLESMSFRLPALYSALNSSHNLESLVLQGVELDIRETDPPTERVFAPRLKDVRIHMCKVEWILAVLDVLRPEEIRSLEVPLNLTWLSPAERRLADVVVSSSEGAKMRRLRYFGKNMEFGIGPQDDGKDFVRRFVSVEWLAATIILQHLARQHSLYTTLEDVTLEVTRLWTLAGAGDTLANVVNLRVNRGDCEQTITRVLEAYVFEKPKITYPRLKTVYLFDHDADAEVLDDELLVAFKEQLGGDNVQIQEAFVCPRAGLYPSTCKPH